VVADQPGDLDGVVGEDPEPAPGSGAADVVEEGAVPAVAAFEGGDAALAAGAPLQQAPEPSVAFDLFVGTDGFPFRGMTMVLTPRARTRG
jgi:hypothetical protein